MGLEIDVSVIIPTYNRRELVQRAIRSVLEQTREVQEIIVVDDGSSDGTQAAIAAAFGNRVHCVGQANGGVSSARNHGLRLARGRLLALLDSDDEWLPEKTRLQAQWLDERPDFGMVLCDVERTDAQHQPFDVMRRREVLPEDGQILKWVLLNPFLVPASVLMRREVYDSVGGFDETLATGEDLDLHLRVAARWKIGVVEQTLVRAMRGHGGLSFAASAYDDYVRVIERAAAAAEDKVPSADRARALLRAYERNARGMLYQRRWADAWRMWRKAWAQTEGAGARARLLGLIPVAARSAVASLRSAR